eukprot:361562-Chlamydomonas_euryale.AAC.3
MWRGVWAGGRGGGRCEPAAGVRRLVRRLTHDCTPRVRASIPEPAPLPLCLYLRAATGDSAQVGRPARRLRIKPGSIRPPHSCELRHTTCRGRRMGACGTLATAATAKHARKLNGSGRGGGCGSSTHVQPTPDPLPPQPCACAVHARGHARVHARVHAAAALPPWRSLQRAPRLPRPGGAVARATFGSAFDSTPGIEDVRLGVRLGMAEGSGKLDLTDMRLGSIPPEVFEIQGLEVRCSTHPGATSTLCQAGQRGLRPRTESPPIHTGATSTLCQAGQRGLRPQMESHPYTHWSGAYMYARATPGPTPQRDHWR